MHAGLQSSCRMSAQVSRQRSAPALPICITSTSPYRSTISPGRPSDSAWIRRAPSPSPLTGPLAISPPQGEGNKLARLSALRAATALDMRWRKNSASIFSTSRHDQTRAVICELALYAAQARNSPCALRTGSVSPLTGAPSTRSTAPEKIHGWRRNKDFSRPALRRMPGCAVASPACAAPRIFWLSVACGLRLVRLRKSLFPCDGRCGVEGDFVFCWVMFSFWRADEPRRKSC